MWWKVEKATKRDIEEVSKIETQQECCRYLTLLFGSRDDLSLCIFHKFCNILAPVNQWICGDRGRWSCTSAYSVCPSLWGCVLLLFSRGFFEPSRLTLLLFPDFLCSGVSGFDICVLTVNGLQIHLCFQWTAKKRKKKNPNPVNITLLWGRYESCCWN